MQKKRFMSIDTLSEESFWQNEYKVASKTISQQNISLGQSIFLKLFL